MLRCHLFMDVVKQHNPPISKSTSWQMFNDISPRYDLLNHLLSFGLHIHWRRQLAKYLSNQDNQRVLDLATGTADVLLSLFKHNPHIQTGYGIDMADKMLEIGRKKITQHGLDKQIILQHGDANQIPFNDKTFDAVTIAFGIRNMENPTQVLKEMHRVLNKEGRALILEFSLPNNKLLRTLHLFYLRTVVPLVGALFAGHYQAYRYLNQTIETFSYGSQFCQLMTTAGFAKTKAYPLLGGVATIYVGEKC